MGEGWTVHSASDPSRLSDLLQLLGMVRPVDLMAAMEVPVPLRRLHEGDVLFHEGAAPEAIYIVRSGTFKTFSTAEDGYEQVLGFAGRSEVLGFDAIGIGRHPTAAVALEESSVYSVLLRDLFTIGQRVPAFDRALALAVSRDLAVRGELANVMAAVAAEVRLARFLMQLSSRMEACGQSPRRFHLRMNRREIASHLGVAHETVSRSFRALASSRLVKANNREIEIIDMDGLRHFASNTRRPAEEPESAVSHRASDVVPFAARPSAAPARSAHPARSAMAA
jgi:CRP/FNR family transcriptional regulator